MEQYSLLDTVVIKINGKGLAYLLREDPAQIAGIYPETGGQSLQADVLAVVLLDEEERPFDQQILVLVLVGEAMWTQNVQ